MDTPPNNPPYSQTILSPEARIGKVIDGKYLLEELIGVGALGAVYRATQLNLERPVAIKLLKGDVSNPIKLKRLQREALAIARLRHRNIVTVHDWSETRQGEPYIVMELLRGRTLREDLAEQGKYSVDRACRLVADICNAVTVAHGQGIIHRDLKPDNIVLETTSLGRLAKVLDFGTAKLFGDRDQGRTTLTSQKARLGTPLYMSPEQAAGQSVDLRADIYSLGCILFELLTGQPPFTGRSVAMILLKHRGEAPRPISAFTPSVPAQLERIVECALAKEPTARFDSAASLASSLEPFAGASY